MHLTVLGCWAPYPRAGGACSGYLIRDKETAILLEAGNGSLSRLLGIMDFRNLSAVVVSHFHLDHCADLFCLRHALKGARRDGSRSEPLTLFCPGEPADDYQRLAGDADAFLARPVETLAAPNGVPEVTVGRLKLEFLPTSHSLPGYGLRVSDGDRRLVYSGDTAWFPGLAGSWGKSRLLLCEASGFARDEDRLAGMHLTARRAGELAGESGAERLVLTHFWPEYDVKTLCAEAAAACPCAVSPALEGTTYTC